MRFAHNRRAPIAPGTALSELERQVFLSACSDGYRFSKRFRNREGRLCITADALRRLCRSASVQHERLPMYIEWAYVYSRRDGVTGTLVRQWAAELGLDAGYFTFKWEVSDLIYNSRDDMDALERIAAIMNRQLGLTPAS